MSYFVTGATGFIGRFLVDALPAIHDLPADAASQESVNIDGTDSSAAKGKKGEAAKQVELTPEQMAFAQITQGSTGKIVCMNIRFLVAAAAIASASMSSDAQRLSMPLEQATGLRLTESCATEDGPTSAFIDATAQFRAETIAAINNPALDPALLHALWLPVSVREISTLVVIDYVDRFQNATEIVQALNADPALAARGLLHASDAGGSCFSALPPPGFVQVSEYYNPQLNHYQLAVGDAERGAMRPNADRCASAIPRVQRPRNV